jgi:hypothetical protein
VLGTIAAEYVPAVATSSESQPVCFTNPTAFYGLVRQPRLSQLLLITDVSSATLYGVDKEGKDPQLELRTAAPRRHQSLHPEKNQKSSQ